MATTSFLRKIIEKLSTIPLWSIILFSFFIKILVFCYIGPWHKEVEEKCLFSWGDAVQYQSLAEGLMQKHKFTVPGDTIMAKHLPESKQAWLLYYQAGTSRVPFYPMVIASIYYIAGIKPFLVLIAHIFFSLISVWLIYRICLSLFNQKSIATLCCLFYALDIQTIYCTYLFGADTLLTTLFLAAVYFFLNFLSSRSILQLGISGILFGIACLTKPVTTFYPLIILFSIFLFLECSYKKKLLYASIYLLTYLAIIGTWAFRNYTEYNHVALTTNGGWNLLMVNAAYSEAAKTGQNIDTVKLKFQREANAMGFLNKEDPFYHSAIYEKIGSAYIRENWYNFAKCNIEGATLGMYFSLGYMGMAKMFQWTDSSSGERSLSISTNMATLHKHLTMSWKQTVLGAAIFIYLLILYALAIWGIYVLIKNRQYTILLFMAVTIVYFTIMPGANGNFRFKLPITPFLCIMVGYGCNYILEKRKSKVVNS